MEIVNFINGNGSLTSKNILEKFEDKYPNQNSSILGEDIEKFVRMFNEDVSLIDDRNYTINNKNILMYILNRQHMFYLYNNTEKGIIEKWDPSTWQKSKNNSTLYAGICAIVRPIVGFEKTKMLLRKIIDEQNSSGARMLSEISEHFFKRGYDMFRY